MVIDSVHAINKLLPPLTSIQYTNKNDPQDQWQPLVLQRWLVPVVAKSWLPHTVYACNCWWIIYSGSLSGTLFCCTNIYCKKWEQVSYASLVISTSHPLNCPVAFSSLSINICVWPISRSIKFTSQKYPIPMSVSHSNSLRMVLFMICLLQLLSPPMPSSFRMPIKYRVFQLRYKHFLLLSNHPLMI